GRIIQLHVDDITLAILEGDVPATHPVVGQFVEAKGLRSDTALLFQSQVVFRRCLSQVFGVDPGQESSGVAALTTGFAVVESGIDVNVEFVFTAPRARFSESLSRAIDFELIAKELEKVQDRRALLAVIRLGIFPLSSARRTTYTTITDSANR